MGQGGTNMDTKLSTRHLTKEMQDLLLLMVNIIRGSIRFKKGSLVFCEEQVYKVRHVYFVNKLK